MSGLASGAPVAPPCADTCRQVIVDVLAEHGGEANASWRPPLFPSGYEPLNMTCPHGFLWFAEPTSEQRLRWAEEGVR